MEFTEKPISEYTNTLPRNDENYNKQYWEGRYGADHYIMKHPITSKGNVQICQ